jgi:hypothetical protein
VLGMHADVETKTIVVGVKLVWARTHIDEQPEP